MRSSPPQADCRQKRARAAMCASWLNCCGVSALTIHAVASTPDSVPWRAVGKLQAASTNLRVLCTGTLIDPSRVRSGPGMAHGPLRGPNCGRRSRNSSASPRERPSDGTARRLRGVEGEHRRNATVRRAARFLALFLGSSRQRMTVCRSSPSKSAPPTYHRNTRLMRLVPGAAGCRIRTGCG